MGLLNIKFFLICFGILGCYAAWRTTHRAWLKVALGLLIVVCLVQLGMNRFFPPQQRSLSQTLASASSVPSARSNPIHRAGITGWFQDQWDALEADSCALSYIRETPLSPIVYIMQMHKFMIGVKQMQGAPGDITSASKLLVQSFGDGDPATNNGQSLCDSFGKWATKVAARPKGEQKEIWDNLRSNIEEDNDHP